MNNRDNNENIYRHLEKCYALLQVHILFSFHTLIYYNVKNTAKLGKIIEKIREFQRKSENIGENHSFSFLFIPNDSQFHPDFML